MGTKLSWVFSNLREDEGPIERRKSPRIQCRLEAFLPDCSKVSVENISTGGLLISEKAEQDVQWMYPPYSDLKLSISFPYTDELVEVQGKLLRVDRSNGCIHAAVRFEELKDQGPLDAFLQKVISNPFNRYFLTQEFEPRLQDHKLLKLARTRRMFKRIQECLMDDAYTFQQPIDMLDDATVIIGGSRKIMMSSYSYLGLLKDPRIIAASIEAIRTYGTGASGVRMLTGTTTLHLELEKRIAEFKQTEAAVVYSSGFLTNLAVISTLFDHHDVIFADYLAHQSIFDACKLSGAKLFKFKHNDIDDLQRLVRASPSANKKLIVTDAVFSMDGDIACLPEIVALARQYRCAVMIDEAHAIGVLGETGRGIDEHFNLSSADIDIFMGTLSKAVPSSGGYVAGRGDLIYYLKHASNPYVFSAALSPAETAAALRALDLIKKEPWRVKRLRENINHFVEGMRANGFTIMNSETAIIPILIGDDRKTFLLTKMMNERNVFVCPVVFPAVPLNKSRIRNCIMANHTREQLDYVLEAYKESGKRLGLI